MNKPHYDLSLPLFEDRSDSVPLPFRLRAFVLILCALLLVITLIMANTSIQPTVSARGWLEPTLISPIRAGTSGIIVRVGVKSGGHVHSGDTLVVLEQLVVEARERFGRLHVLAPTSGVVITEDLDRLTGASVSPSEVLLEVADLSSWRAVLSVNEKDAGRIRPGDTVRLVIRPLDGDWLTATVERIGLQPIAEGTLAGSGRQYRVIANLGRDRQNTLQSERFRRSYSVEATIITAEQSLVKTIRERVAKAKGQRR